ncbi:MAG: V-type ATP synthase subunit I [Acutalibacteraceae bacterium]|jgi:V/A-type H+-transporting ATPase subunit I
MQKIELIALMQDSQSIVERLQRRGVVELETVDDPRLVRLSTDSSVAQFEKSMAVANEALVYLDDVTARKKPLLGMLKGRREMTTDEFARQKKGTDKTLNKCYDLLQYQKQITGWEGEIAKAQTRLDQLVPWLALDLPQNFAGTRSTRCFIGTLPSGVTTDRLAIALGDTPADVQVVSARKEQTCLAVLCLKRDAGEVQAALREVDFVPLSSPGADTPAQEKVALEKRMEECRDKIDRTRQKIRSWDGLQDDIQFLLDFLTMRRDKYTAISRIGMSDRTVIIRGFIPARYVKGLTAEFEEKYLVAIDVREPEEDEDVPVLLKNNKFAAPVEGVTEMYALPGKKDIDPNGPMAFFYYLLFGMMLSDAGYGLVMTVVTALVLRFTKVEGTLRRSLTMFRNGGISTLIWGALFGSWFGDLPQIIAGNFFDKDIGSTALWFEPLDDPIKLLLFSFAIGIVHLFLGLGIHFHMLWKEGKKFDALCEVIPTYLTVLGAAPLAASILSPMPQVLCTVGGYMALVGVVLVVLTAGRSRKGLLMRVVGGLYGLYNVATGYLSDILSYSRLLALGLATGSIAGVINLIAVMPDNKVVKAVMLIVIGLIGHMANMAINLLGAYVHADRLQFVELFGKFYEGGGRAFRPLKADTKFIKLKKENIYE